MNGHARLLRVTLAVAVALFGVAACGGDDDGGDGGDGTATTAPSTVAALDGRSFVAQSLTGHDLVAGTAVTLTFGDELGASAGCNSLFGRYAVVDGVLQVDQMGGTEMGCEPDLMAQDGWLTGFLTSSPTLALDGDELVLTGEGATMTLLDREVAEPDRPLVGTRWELDTLYDGDTASSVPDSVDAWIELTDDRATGSLGCNGFSATVEIDETAVTFGPVESTLMACEDERGPVEDAVRAVLVGEVPFTIDGPRLELRAGGDAGLGFRAAG